MSTLAFFGVFDVEVTRIVDGATFEALVRLGLESFAIALFRLDGIDVPSIKTEEGKRSAKALSAFIIGRRFDMNVQDEGRFDAARCTVRFGPIDVAVSMVGLGQAVFGEPVMV